MILAGAGIVFKAQRFLRLFLCFICDRLWQNRRLGFRTGLDGGTALAVAD
jgi:hypothetical protein